ncbi:hypothetical protein AB0395_01515 [Streptosporangium sp. NPDC051023]|uniref:hypothetical protein n=1 Tax=Streptosporangium sp. NPDC051023 TaxID=3155410 RepID=UPI00344F0F15
MAFSKRARKVQTRLPEGYFDLPKEERLRWARQFALDVRDERDTAREAEREEQESQE